MKEQEERTMAGCNEEKCTCPNVSCARHGKCCECVNFHRDEKGNLPTCLRLMLEKQKEA